MPQLSPRELLRAELVKSKEPDPHVVARRVALKLSKDQLLEVAGWGLQEMAMEESRTLRAGRGFAVAGPSRRSVARRERERVGGEWKWIDDCTHDDLLLLASEYRERAEAIFTRVRELEALAADLGRSGCATVGEMRKRMAA